MKKPSAMNQTEAQAALDRELRDQAKGLSYSGRRIGALRARLAEFQAAKPVEPPECPGCQQPMLATRDQYKDGTWTAKCWPCTVNGR